MNTGKDEIDMKAKYIAILAAAAAILSFSGCGDTSEEGFVDKKESTTSAAQTTAAVTAAPEAAADNAAAPAADSAADPAPAATGSESTADSSEAADSTADTGASAGDHIFSTPNGEYTFAGLNADGLANTANGKWYAIIPSDGAAGHMYYQTYYSTNGVDWTQGGMYDETNGNNYHYALPDGRILLFNTEGPIASNVPIVSAISLGDDNAVKSTPVTDFFNNQYLDDGSQLSATEGLTFYVTYNGGYNFTFSFTDMNGIIVYNVNTDLDEGTLLMKD